MFEQKIKIKDADILFADQLAGLFIDQLQEMANKNKDYEPEQVPNE